jgi:colicin import membrane protein
VRPFVLSIFVHVAIVLLLASGWWWMRSPPPPPQPLAIEATIVDARDVARDANRGDIQRAPESTPAPAEPVAAQPAAAATPEPVAQAAEPPPPPPTPKSAPPPVVAQVPVAQQPDPQVQAAAQRAVQEAERQRAAERKAAADAAAAAARRVAEERARAEKQMREAREQQQKAEREAAAHREAEQQRAEREAELRSQLAGEERAMAARAGGMGVQWAAAIQAKIQRAWIRPASARSGLDCTVSVTQVPGGEVVAARVTGCNGDETVQQSIVAAVYRASPLPPPPDPTLFERNLEVRFRPND